MQLFITYAHESLIEVQELVEVLTVGGHAAWFDNQLLPGQDWKQELREAIQRCDAYLYALSKDAVDSEWCQWEFATAVRLQKAVIPVLLEPDVPVPRSLQDLQFADFTQGIAPKEIAKLMGALASMQRLPASASPPVPADPKGIPSRAWESMKHWTDAFVPTAHQPQTETEDIIGKFAANLWRGWESVGGRMLLTNHRLLFEAHRGNYERQPLAIPLNEITGVIRSRTLGIVPNGLTIRCVSGDEYRFVVGARKKIISIIEQYGRLAGQMDPRR